MSRTAYYRAVYLFLGMAALIYVMIRAFTVGVTYDEAWTIESFVPQNVWDILMYSGCEANNHLLNTLLIKLFYLSGNSSLFAARLPNVLAFILFLFFSYRIVTENLKPITALSCFLLLLFNPYMLDFFSLARGYGLALGFMMAALYCFFEFVKNNSTRKGVWAMMLGAAAVLSVFSFLNAWLLMVFLICSIALYFRKGQGSRKIILSGILIVVIMAFLISVPLYKLNQNGSLYYGGSSNFYHDTLLSIAKYFFYTQTVSEPVQIALNIFLALLILTAIVSFVLRRTFLSVKTILWIFLFLCILSLVVQHYVFGTLYLLDRAALFFYPLFIFCLCFSVNDFEEKWYAKGILLIVIAFGINFFYRANLYYTANWFYDARSEEILNAFNQQALNENRIISIDFSWPFERSFGYYYKKNQYSNLQIVKNQDDKDAYNVKADYYIFLDHSLEKVNYEASQQKVLQYTKKYVSSYPREHIVIYSNIIHEWK